MTELLQEGFSIHDLAVTALLGLVLCHWLSVMIGLEDGVSRINGQLTAFDVGLKCIEPAWSSVSSLRSEAVGLRVA